MTRDLTSESPDDGELLAAYLAGDLSDDKQAAVNARLAREPRLARQLDELAELLTRLHGTDDVTLPQGYTERLRDRLEDERAAAVVPLAEPQSPPTSGRQERRVAPATAAASRPADATVTELPRRLSPLLAAAAVLVVLGLLGAAAVAGIGSLSGGAGDAAGEAGGEEAGGAAASLEARAADQSTPLGDPAAGATKAAGDGRTRLEQSAEPNRGTASPSLPVLSDRRGASRLNLGRLEAVARQALDSTANPRVRAAALTQAVADAPAFPGGLSPSACLDDVVAEAPGPVVPVAVRALDVGGRVHLAYAVAQPSEPDGPLATARVIVADAETCRFLDADELTGSP